MSIPGQLMRFFLPATWPKNYAAMFAEIGQGLWVNDAIAFGLFAGVTGSFVLRARDRSMSLIACFFAFYFFGYILWWIPADGRYLLPIVGLFPVFIIESFRAIYAGASRSRGFLGIAPERIIHALLVLMIMDNVYHLAIHWKDSGPGIRAPDALALSSWINKNLREDEHYMFPKPRALAWMSGRTGAAFVTPQTKETFGDRVRKYDVDYLILNNAPEVPSAYLAVLREGSIPYRPVYSNNTYVVYKIKE